MQVNKEQFRQLIEAGNIGSVFNRLSDISHFMGEGALKEKVGMLAEQYQEYLEQEEAGNATESSFATIREALYEFIDEMPDELAAGAGESKEGSGCMGVLAVLFLVAVGLSVWCFGGG